MKRTLIIANGILLLFTIVINYVSNTGLLNGNTMKIISDKYFNYFTPAGYAFSIWGLIYISLLGFVFYTGRGLFNKKADEPVLTKIGWWFVVSCIANSLWVVVWLYDYISGSVVVMMILLFSLLKIINILKQFDFEFSKRKILIHWPFQLYAGWISVAIIANIAAWLTKNDLYGAAASDTTLTIVLIIIAGIINAFMMIKHQLLLYGLVGVWALVAISVSNNTQNILYTCYGVIILLLIVYFRGLLRIYKII